VATVLDRNARMLKLAKELGFEEDRASKDGHGNGHESGVKAIFLPLQP
jgi:hypothetical protein